MEDLNGSIGIKQDREVYPPLGLLYLSAIIKKECDDIEVCVFDLHFEGVKSVQLGKTWSVGNGVRLGTLNDEVLEKTAQSGCTYLIGAFSLVCKPLPNTDLYRETQKVFSGKEEPAMSSDAIDYKFGASKGMFLDALNQESVLDKIYSSNLEINFKDNVNLAGRNVERAISNFEKVVKIANEHAFAWNCLAKGYKMLNMREASQDAMQKTISIIGKSEYWKNKFEELDFDIEEKDKEMV